MDCRLPRVLVKWRLAKLEAGWIGAVGLNRFSQSAKGYQQTFVTLISEVCLICRHHDNQHSATRSDIHIWTAAMHCRCQISCQAVLCGLRFEEDICHFGVSEFKPVYRFILHLP